MGIFQHQENKKPSILGRILKKTPKENALIEINNILLENEDDLTKVTPEQIQDIANKYKLRLDKKFAATRIGLFRKYIHHILEDHMIDEDEQKTFLHLKKILHLKDVEVKRVLNFETRKIYEREVKKALSGGKLSLYDKNNLGVLKTNLLISDEDASSIMKVNSEKVFNDFIAKAISDERFSDTEYDQMNEIILNLGIEPKLSERMKKDLERFRLYWQIENGKLPILKSPISIQKSEILHFMTNINWKEQRRVTQRINYGGPTARIKITKGVYYRMGSVSAKTVSEDVWQIIDKGNLYLTNKRLIFMGGRGNKTIRLDKILDITPYKNGVDIQKDSGKSPFLEFSQDVDIFSMVLVRLMND